MMSEPCLAYIDPGTAQNVFAGLATILGAIGALALVLLWPLRVFYARLRNRYRALGAIGKASVWCTAAAVVVMTGVGAYAVVSRLGDEQAPLASAVAQQHPEIVARDAPYERVLVLGMDGLDPGILREMMAAGELPHFSQLAEIGHFGELPTSNPPASPVAWSNLATGCDPGEHGVFDFIHRLPHNYLPYFSLRSSASGLAGTTYRKAREQEGFWAYTSAAGVPTTVVRWPVSFPAEQVSGRFLSGFGVPDLLGGEGRYTFYTAGPVLKDDPGLHHIVEVSWDGKSLETEIQGPATGETSSATLPLVVTRTGDDRVRLDVGGNRSVEAIAGEWSDWLELDFPIGFGKQVHGMVKFMLTDLEPELRLVASPIHMNPSQQAFPITWPTKYGAELESQIGRFHTLGMPEQIQPLTHGRYGYDAFLAECKAVHAERCRMLELELDRFEQGLLAFVFDTSDRAEHAFWATRDPEHPAYDADEAARYGHVIGDMYRAMDDVIGTVMPRLDDQTLLLVVSDHGFNSFRRSVHVNRWLIDHGYMVLKDGRGPEVRELYGNVEWPATRAYAYGFSSISLNLSTREQRGIVDPVTEYRSLCEEIAEKLRTWQDPDTGETIVHEVYLAEDLYDGPQTSRRGPDLVLGLKPGYRVSWQTALGAAPLVQVEDNNAKWSGDHLIDPSFVPGVIFASQPLEVEEPTQFDLCPTVLACLGIEPLEHMRGRPLITKAPQVTPANVEE